MRHFFNTTVCALIMALCGSTAGVSAEMTTVALYQSAESPVSDPGVADTVRIGPAQSGLGAPVVAPVYFFSDEILGGIQIIVGYEALKYICDSVSFAGTSLTGGAQLYTIDTTTGIINAGVLYTGIETIPPQTGFFGSLYLHPVGPLQGDTVILDTTSLAIDTINTIVTVFSASNPAFSIFPQFILHPIVIENYVPGDASNDRRFNIADVTFLIARIFSGGPAPPIPAAADPTADCKVNIADVTFMIARIFAGGAPPELGCAI